MQLRGASGISEEGGAGGVRFEKGSDLVRSRFREHAQGGCRSTARPPCAWNSAPVTRTALKGGDSGETPAKVRPNLSVPPFRLRRSTSAKRSSRASPRNLRRAANSSMLLVLLRHEAHFPHFLRHHRA